MSSDRGGGDSFAALFESSVNTQRRNRLHVGERLEVTVVSIGRDAVFADLGAKQEGYFDRGELVAADGTLSVDVGSTLAAIVAEVDDEAGQIRLRPAAMRGSATPAALEASGPTFTEGTKIKGVVTGVERYGVFVQIDGTKGRNGRGLIPGAETGTPRGADLKRHFAKDQPVEAMIVNIAEDGKIRLSIKALSAASEQRDFEQYRDGAAPGAAAVEEDKKQPNKPKGKPAVKGFGTLGDLLSKAGKK